MLRVPDWFARSLVRHRLWRLRDQIVDDVLAGRLPGTHAAVKELLRRTDWTIRKGTELNMLAFHVWAWVLRRSDEDARKPVLRATPEPASLKGLAEDERERVDQYREHLALLASASVLLGTWVGIATVLRFVVPAVRRRRRLRAPYLTGVA
jgi:hypothetical protein